LWTLSSGESAAKSCPHSQSSFGDEDSSLSNISLQINLLRFSLAQRDIKYQRKRAAQLPIVAFATLS
jgi:hypothetical protein